MAAFLETAQEAARLYRSTGAIAPSLLRDPVFRAWERSHLGGADPRRLQADSLSSLDTERLLERHEPLIHTVRPYLLALARASGNERHAATLSNAGAVILDVVGDEQSVHGEDRVPGPGAVLAEGAAGANGVASALAESGYVEIVGPEHFIEGFHCMTCQGIPLRDGAGGMAGAISVTVRRYEVGRRMREIMICAAHAIEMDLLADRLKGDLLGVLMAQGQAATELERLLGDLREVQAAARFRLECAADQLSQSHVQRAGALLELASGVLDRFRRHAALWRGLALDEPAAPRPLTVDTMVRELVELLEVEANACQVEIVLHEVEPVVLGADPPTLARALFRCLLGAVQAARGGVVYVDLHRRPDGAELCAAPVPGNATAPGKPAPLRVTVRGERSS